LKVRKLIGMIILMIINYIKYLIDLRKLIFFVILIISNLNNVQSIENKILFKINNKAFTSIDYENRIEYLNFVGSNQNLNKKIIIEDFISATLFYEFYKKSKNNFQIEEKINEIFEKINKVNEENKKEYDQSYNKNNIIQNIKLDFVRKTILEKELNNNKKNLLLSKEDIDLLYYLKIRYINFEIQNNEILNKINEIDNLNVDKLKLILDNYKINYFEKDKEINKINKIDSRIKSHILSNKNFLFLKESNKVSFIFIEKKFETFDGITVEIYSVKSNDELNSDYLKCKNLSKIKNDENILNKEYKFIDLNKDLKNNLININDYIKLNNNDENIYIILCNINFDKEILNNINLNKIININVIDLEKKFINKFSKIYNLERSYE